jgi:hypothetical protein
MKKKLLLVLSLVLAATIAAAANVHLKGGKNAEPTFFDNGLKLEVIGAIAGLGNENGLVTLIAEGNPIATCQNPGNGEHFPPGQNPAPVTLTGTQAFDPDDFEKNGNYTFTVETDAPETPVAGAPDCPNVRWTEEIIDVAFTSATIIVEQPEYVTVLQVDCTINPPSSDGQIRGADVVCVQY